MKASEKKSKAPEAQGGVLVSQVHQLSGRVFSRILKEHGLEELGPSLGRIVFALWLKDGITQTELAELTKLDKSGLALSLRKLEDSGYVRRAPDEEDHRIVRVFLTDMSVSLHGAYRKASDEMIALYYRGFGAEKIRDFERTLQEIIANLESADR